MGAEGTVKAANCAAKRAVLSSASQGSARRSASSSHCSARHCASNCKISAVKSGLLGTSAAPAVPVQGEQRLLGEPASEEPERDHRMHLDPGDGGHGLTVVQFLGQGRLEHLELLLGWQFFFRNLPSA